MRRSIMSLVAAVLAGSGHNVTLAPAPRPMGKPRSHYAEPRARKKAASGHRRAGYKRTPADIARIEAAAQKRERRGAKLQRDYDKCVANNPCLA